MKPCGLCVRAYDQPTMQGKAVFDGLVKDDVVYPSCANNA